MTDLFDIEPILDDWFADGSDYLPDRSIEAVLGTIQRTPQRRPAMRLPWRFRTMSTTFKLAIGAAAVIAVLLGGMFLLRPSASDQGVGGPPAASASAAASPSAAPSPSVAPSPTPYSTSKFEIPIQLAIRDGWTLDADYAGGVDLTGPAEPASIMNIATMTVRGTKADDPWVPWPTDIYKWLSSRPEFRVTAPRPITVGGRPGTVIDVEVIVPRSDSSEWIRNGPVGGGNGIKSPGAGWGVHLVVIPTGNGTGMVAYTDAPAADFDGAVTTLDRLLATLQFR